MNTLRLVVVGLVGSLLVFSGCGSIDVGQGTNPDRVLNGVVNVGAPLPAGAEITVRLIAPPASNEPPRPAGAELPVVARPTLQNLERVVAEQTQTLTAGTSDPVPFRLSYYADDAALRRGLSLEARVSVGGHLRYRTINAHVVTLNSSFNRQELALQPVQ